LGGDGQKIRALARDLFDAAARHRTELVHTPFYGGRCVTLQTSAPTHSIHANCGRATPRGEAHCARALSFWNSRKRQASCTMPRRTRALPAFAQPFSRRLAPLSSGEPVRPA